LVYTEAYHLVEVICFWYIVILKNSRFNLPNMEIEHSFPKIKNSRLKLLGFGNSTFGFPNIENSRFGL